MPKRIIRKIFLPPNISTYLSRTLIIITILSTLLIGSILIFQMTIQFNKTIEISSSEYFENQKIHIKEIVLNEIEYIKNANKNFEEEIKLEIKQNVENAIITATSIYEKYNGKISEHELKTLIINAISSIKFNEKFQEVFISDLNGYGIYYPNKPEYTGKLMIDFKDINNNYVVREELALLKKNEGGFIFYDMHPQSHTEKLPDKKITYIKKFSHFNWYFGSKQHLNDYFPEFKNEIAEKISSVRFKYGGYVFMNNKNGTPIVMDGKIYKGEINLLNNVDEARKNVFSKQLNAVKNPDGDFFYYSWNKMNDSVFIEKCSFVKSFDNYNWIIGAGFYLDEINQSIVENEQVLRKIQQKSIFIIIGFLILLLLIEGLIIYQFNNRYKSDFERFFKFFFQSQKSFGKLDLSGFHFSEFKKAAKAANKMNEKREKTEKQLIFEQKRAQESDNLKSAFLANMSHEIRTPMNAIIGFSELLDEEYDENDSKGMYIKLIRKNGDALMNLINDIIDISKIEANQLSIKKRSFHLQKFLNEIYLNYSELLESKKDNKVVLEFNNEIDESYTCFTDEYRLKQILDNLIGNAVKFTQVGKIEVKIHLNADSLYFSVSDTGIGIPKEQQQTIFERFIQVEQGANKYYGGTGLGLAISKNLIQLLGGSISLKSEPGKGSTFYFHIPGK